MSDYDSRTADKFVFRLPQGMREAIKAKAKANHRSMNNQLILMVRQGLEGTDTPATQTTATWIPQIGQLVQLRDPLKVLDTVEMGIIVGFVRVEGVLCARIEAEGSSKVEFEDLNKICPVCISL